jgi:hypothetical protein
MAFVSRRDRDEKSLRDRRNFYLSSRKFLKDGNADETFAAG